MGHGKDVVLDAHQANETSQGTFSQLPRGVLESFASKTGVPAEKLSTILISFSAKQLYSAVLAYAEVATAENAEPGGKLMITPEDQFETIGDAESESDSDHYASTEENLDEGENGLQPHRRHSLTQALKFCPGLGLTSFTWPPPLHLSATVLRHKAQNGNAKHDGGLCSQKDSMADVEYSASRSRSESSTTVVPHHGSTDGHVIHMAHYVVGPPQKVDCLYGLHTHRELFLATSGSAQSLKQFCTEVLQWHADKAYRPIIGPKYALYRFQSDSDGSGDWWEEGFKQPRPSSSVILAPGQMDDIMEDVKDFLSKDTRIWYMQHGLPYRRAYLFHGPPGTGKTSTIRALASSFKLACCYLSVTGKNFSNQGITDAVCKLPRRALLVMEDVDALFDGRRGAVDAGQMTFSGLLNALDGVVSAEGVVTVLTTNHVDRLDAAVTRSGRVDRAFAFELAGPAEVQLVFEAFYPGEKEVGERFVKRVCEEGKISVAELQQLFIKMRGKGPEECLERAREFLDQQKKSKIAISGCGEEEEREPEGGDEDEWTEKNDSENEMVGDLKSALQVLAEQLPAGLTVNVSGSI